MTDLLTDPYLDELRKCAPSAPLCGAGSDTPLPQRSGAGATETTRKAWRDLFLTMVRIDVAFLIAFALAWLLVR